MYLVDDVLQLPVPHLRHSLAADGADRRHQSAGAAVAEAVPRLALEDRSCHRLHTHRTFRQIHGDRRHSAEL